MGADIIKKQKNIYLIKKFFFLVLILSFCTACVEKETKADQNAQSKVLDEYFEAVNNIDPEAVEELCNNRNELKDITRFNFIVDYLSYTPGLLYLHRDFFTEDNDVAIAYLRGLGYEGSYTDMVQSFNADSRGDGDILLSKFKTSYDLIEMKKAEDCKKIQFRSGLSLIDIPDLKEEIEKSNQNILVDDVYIAKIDLYWEYNDHPYGNDEKLWDLPDFPDAFPSYDETNAASSGRDYYQVIYSSNGEWYVWWDSIIKYSYCWAFEL